MLLLEYQFVSLISSVIVRRELEKGSWVIVTHMNFCHKQFGCISIKSHIHELVVCSAAEVAVDMTLICLSALHTISSLSVPMRGCWIYVGFTLRVLFQPFRIILTQNYRLSLFHHWARWRLNHQVSIWFTVAKVLIHCCLKYTIWLFPVWALIIRYCCSTVLPCSGWGFALRAVVWKGVCEKSQHTLFLECLQCVLEWRAIECCHGNS